MDATPPVKGRHPVAFIFHLAFKVAAIVYYILCTWFIDSFVTNFVVCVVLLALDFWTVKNVTGRLLVGMRWWNEANETGTAWRFEQAAEGSRVIHGSEKWWFWIAQLGNLGAWIFLSIFSLFRLKFDYLLLDIIAILLQMSNLVGYFKCSREAKQQLQNYGASLISGAVSQGVAQRFSAAVGRV